MSTYLGGSGVGPGATAAQNLQNQNQNQDKDQDSTGSFGDLLTDWGGDVVDFVVGDGGILDKMGDPNDAAGQLLNLGVASFLSSEMQPDRPDVGYQGEIPKFTKVRQRVEQPLAPTEGKRTGIIATNPIMERTKVNPEYDPVTNPDVPERIPRDDIDISNRRLMGDRYARNYERRPGGRGRRYFTDTQYAKTPEGNLDPPTLEEAEAKAAEQAEELKIRNKDTANFAAGGLASMQSGQLFNNGYYLGGSTDGMADKVPARIDGKQEARLSDGEFVIPADVVSHLGNGNSDAGAQQLHNMMDNVRTARTGNPEQGKQIDPQKFMPKFAKGGIAKFTEGGDVATETPVGQEVGSSGALANWAGEYVSNMLGKGVAEAEEGYQAYTGPLTAGASTLQEQAMTGISQLNNPIAANSIVNQMGAFNPTQAATDRFMNPYTQEVIDRSAADMRRQDQINQLQQRQQLASAGAFGGSRDALLRAEAASNLNRDIGNMAAGLRAEGYSSALDRAQQRQQDINQYGFDVLGAQMNAGQTARGIASEGIAADYEQFREERDYDAKMVQYLQSLLQGLPVAARTTSYTEPSGLAQLMQGQEGLNYLLDLFGYEKNQTNIGT